jgi:hypothetical protein
MSSKKTTYFQVIMADIAQLFENTYPVTTIGKQDCLKISMGYRKNRASFRKLALEEKKLSKSSIIYQKTIGKK